MSEPLCLVYLAVNDHDRERVLVQVVGVELNGNGLIFGNVDYGSRSRTLNRLDLIAFDVRVLERERVASAECFFGTGHVDLVAVDVVARVIVAAYVRRLILDLVLFALVTRAEQIHAAAHKPRDQSERYNQSNNSFCHFSYTSVFNGLLFCLLVIVWTERAFN